MNMVAKERLYLTKDKGRLVGEGDKRAAFLYAAVGDEVPDDAAKRFGLADGRLKGGKERPADEDKERKEGGDKGDAGDDLTKVKGIGAATAKALAGVGITTFVQLTAIDTANPPDIAAGVGKPDWASWVEAAKKLTPSGEE